MTTYAEQTAAEIVYLSSNLELDTVQHYSHGKLTTLLPVGDGTVRFVRDYGIDRCPKKIVLERYGDRLQVPVAGVPPTSLHATAGTGTVSSCLVRPHSRTVRLIRSLNVPVPAVYLKFYSALNQRLQNDNTKGCTLHSDHFLTADPPPVHPAAQ